MVHQNRTHPTEDDVLILVVDDEPQNLKIVGEILKREGLRFIFATTGEEALEAVRSEKPSLILLDIMMPGHDGLSICRMLKNDAEVSGIPIIFLTAKAERENVVEGFHAGGVDYVVKPFSAEELIARVRTHLDLYKSRNQLKSLYERKSELISMLAHGVKNPAGAIYSIARSLILDIENEEADLQEIHSFLKLIDASATGLADLVEKTLDQEQKEELQSGYTEEGISHVADIIEYLVTLNTVHARKKQITIQFQKDCEPLVSISSRTLIEMYDNIINNAVKYSVQNSNIYVRVFIPTTKPDYFRFEVQDSADLIAEADKEKLFMKFSKGDSSLDSENSSHGVGLSIVKRLVNQCDGVIGINQRADKKGNIFYIELPLTD